MRVEVLLHFCFVFFGGGQGWGQHAESSVLGDRACMGFPEHVDLCHLDLMDGAYMGFPEHVDQCLLDLI